MESKTSHNMIALTKNGVLNMALQVKVVESLLSLTDVDKVSSNQQKCLSATDIIKTKEALCKLLIVRKSCIR